MNTTMDALQTNYKKFMRDEIIKAMFELLTMVPMMMDPFGAMAAEKGLADLEKAEAKEAGEIKDLEKDLDSDDLDKAVDPLKAQKLKQLIRMQEINKKMNTFKRFKLSIPKSLRAIGMVVGMAVREAPSGAKGCALLRQHRPCHWVAIRRFRRFDCVPLTPRSGQLRLPVHKQDARHVDLQSGWNGRR